MKLTEWKTPFARIESLGVHVVPDRDVSNFLDVEVTCVDNRRFKCHFEGVWAYKCIDETVYPAEPFASITGHAPGVTCYVWEGSPWMKEFDDTKRILIDFYKYRDLKHYLILSAGEIVEVLAGESVTVEEVKTV